MSRSISRSTSIYVTPVQCQCIDSSTSIPVNTTWTNSTRLTGHDIGRAISVTDLKTMGSGSALLSIPESGEAIDPRYGRFPIKTAIHVSALRSGRQNDPHIHVGFVEKESTQPVGLSEPNSDSDPDDLEASTMTSDLRISLLSLQTNSS